MQWNGMTYLECQVDSEKQETGGGGLLPALDLLQPGELETDLDEVLVSVSVISANDIQRPEVKIGHSHATIPRHYSWVLSPGPGPHLPRHARPGAQQPVHGLLPVRQHLVNSWITKNIFFKKVH